MKDDKPTFRSVYKFLPWYGWLIACALLIWLATLSTGVVNSILRILGGISILYAIASVIYAKEENNEK